MASKKNIVAGIIERFPGLRRIVPDSAGRIRATIEASTNTQAVSGTVAVSTATTVTTLTNWGTMTAAGYSQTVTNQTNFRRNLIVS